MTPKQKQAIEMIRLAGYYRAPIINKNIPKTIFNCNELLKQFQNEEIEHKEIINFKPVFREFLDMAKELEIIERGELVKFVPIIDVAKQLIQQQKDKYRNLITSKKETEIFYTIKPYGEVSDQTQKLLDNSTDDNFKISEFNPRQEYLKIAEHEKQFEIIEVKDKNSYEKLSIERYVQKNEIGMIGAGINGLNFMQAESLKNHFMSLGFLMTPNVSRTRYFTYTEVAHLGYNFKIIGEK